MAIQIIKKYWKTATKKLERGNTYIIEQTIEVKVLEYGNTYIIEQTIEVKVLENGKIKLKAATHTKCTLSIKLSK